MLELSSSLLLFASAFLAATILPLSSEFYLLKLLADGQPAASLWAIATAGNTLGSAVNWWLGLQLLRFQQRPWFYFDEQQIARGQRWFNRYGRWTLLLAWLPLVGDVLTLIAGVMRVRLPLFLLLVASGKGLRYLVVVGLQYPLDIP